MSTTLKACAALGLGALLSLSACTKDNPAPSPFATLGQGTPTATATTPSADPTAKEYAAIERDLKKFVGLLAQGGASTSPVFDYSSVATGEMLNNLKTDQNDRAELGNRLEGSATLTNIEVVSVTGLTDKSKGVARGCLTENSRLLNKKAGVIQSNQDSGIIEYQLIKVSGKWLVFKGQGESGTC